MANILLVQPNWKHHGKIKDPQKYWPWPLLKLAGLFRFQGNNVALVVGNKKAEIPFIPDKIYITTVFSWWFPYVQDTVMTYRMLYPNAEIHLGGVHVSLMPEVYKRYFPFAKIHIGTIKEAENIEPAWDLLPETFRTQIIRFSQGCIRKCSFCYCHYEPYKAYTWDEIARKIRFTRLILNDNNFLAHPYARDILKRLTDFKVNGKSISSVEIQGGFDVRILSKNLDLIPLMREAKVKNVRLAWDGGLEMASLVETCLEALDKAGYDLRNIRCYMLYNHDLPFETIIQKLRYFEKWKIGPIHSRFRPLWLLNDGYIPQKKHQTEKEYYIHRGWTDRKIRIVGSLASDISRMARARVSSLDEVRAYYGRPSVKETLKAVA